MIKKDDDVIVGWGMLGAIALPILTLLVQHPFIPDTPTGHLFTADLYYPFTVMFSGIEGILLGVTVGSALFWSRQRFWRKSGWLCIVVGALMAGWQVVWLCSETNDSTGTDRVWSHDVWVVGVLPSLFWAIALLIWGYKLLAAHAIAQHEVRQLEAEEKP